MHDLMPCPYHFLSDMTNSLSMIFYASTSNEKRLGHGQVAGFRREDVGEPMIKLA